MMAKILKIAEAKSKIREKELLEMDKEMKEEEPAAMEEKVAKKIKQITGRDGFFTVEELPKRPARAYSPAAGEQVREEMDEMKAGTLRSGGSGAKVTNPKQAIAIGLAEARRAGKKVPPNPNAPARKKKR